MQNKLVAINRFDNDANLLRLDLSTGAGKLMPRDGIDEDQISFGMFEVENHAAHADIIALLATPDGPLLFLNGNQYRPETGKTKISIKDD